MDKKLLDDLETMEKKRTNKKKNTDLDLDIFSESQLVMKNTNYSLDSAACNIGSQQ